MNPSFMGRICALTFAGGAAIAVLSMVLPHPSEADEAGFIALGAVSAVAAVALWALAERIPFRAFYLIEAASTVMITLAIYFAGEVNGSPPANVDLLYLFPTIFSAYFFSRPWVAAEIGFIFLCYGALILTVSPPGIVARWVVAMGALVTVAAVVVALRESLVGDATQRQRTSSLLEATLEATADGILVVDREGRMTSWNRQFVEMWRIPEEIQSSGDDRRALEFVLDQLSQPDRFLAKVRELYDEHAAEGHDLIEFKDGRVFERYSKPMQVGGEYAGRVWSFSDITAQRRFETRLQHAADHDPLTDLYNRRRLEEELEREAKLAARYGYGGALLLLDLDNFKYVNDTLGHAAGDELIKDVGGLLRERLRETDIIARLGGDEFAVLLPRANEEQASTVATALLRTVRERAIALGERRVRVTTSVGVVPFTGTEATATELLVAADLAMYEAKDAGRDRLAVYAPSHARRAESRARFTWGQRIRNALEREQFTLHAQPILDLAAGTITRYELLLRMIDDDGELIPPGAFLATAERFGLVQEIDRWVVRSAIAILAGLRRNGAELDLEVNISGHSMADPQLPGIIRGQLAQSGVDPSDLTFEVTETAAIANMPQARDFAETLSALGCSFALDDFGSGFGSFYYLKHLPVDLIKIDGNFIRELPRSRIDQLAVESMVQVASGLGMRTIAEFAADEETLEMLRSYGVDFAQGYGVGEPRPVAELGTTAEVRLTS